KNESSRIIGVRVKTIIGKRELQRVVNAAIIIQRNWRRYYIKNINLENIAAAIILQAKWRECMQAGKRKFNLKEIILIQNAWRLCLAKKRKYRNKCAILIQKTWRGYKARKELRMKDEMAKKISRQWLLFICRTRFLSYKWAKNVILR